MSKAHEEGRQAYRDGKALSDCPYTDNDDQEHDWELGFLSEEEHDADNE